MYSVGGRSADDFELLNWKSLLENYFGSAEDVCKEIEIVKFQQNLVRMRTLLEKVAEKTARWCYCSRTKPHCYITISCGKIVVFCRFCMTESLLCATKVLRRSFCRDLVILVTRLLNIRVIKPVRICARELAAKDFVLHLGGENIYERDVEGQISSMFIPGDIIFLFSK